MCWNTSSAFTPVALALRGPATRKIVRTLGEAAHLLLKDWPSDDGEEYVAAVKACVDAITGEIAPERFREALLRAANEAGITVLTVVQQPPASVRRPSMSSQREVSPLPNSCSAVSPALPLRDHVAGSQSMSYDRQSSFTSDTGSPAAETIVEP